MSISQNKKNVMRPYRRLKSSLIQMLTYRERYPEEFKEENENDKQKELELKRSIRLTHAHETVQRELNAISFIDKEVSKEYRSKPTTPNPIPSGTGYSYQEWKRKNELKHSLNRATIGLSMRISQRPTTHTARSAVTPKNKNTSSNQNRNFQTYNYQKK